MLPGLQLVISLRHNTSGGSTTTGPEKKPQGQKLEHDHVLEHSLHQLLREVHHKNTHHPFPHPSSAPLGPSKRRCLAGPSAADKHQLLEMTQRCLFQLLICLKYSTRKLFLEKHLYNIFFIVCSIVHLF